MKIWRNWNSRNGKENEVLTSAKPSGGVICTHQSETSSLYRTRTHALHGRGVGMGKGAIVSEGQWVWKVKVKVKLKLKLKLKQNYLGWGELGWGELSHDERIWSYGEITFTIWVVKYG
ncbi:hypothetical protein L1987_55117 [Smallanthus sonchifolius]|uniref:Uncharacterized protein n=1 Tax=Smallanthus sonchifolius TaxID=185202 RepID=A0ACB9E9F3_9ASTR|nr:hypothetical protein L1987_55117 [Smallanthus sonchifolius]